MKNFFILFLLVILAAGCSSSVSTSEFNSHSVSFRRFPGKKLVLEMREYHSGVYTLAVSTNLYDGSPVEKIRVDDDTIIFQKGKQIVSLPKGKFNRIYRNLTSIGHEVEVTSREESHSFPTSDIGKQL